MHERERLRPEFPILEKAVYLVALAALSAGVALADARALRAQGPPPLPTRTEPQAPPPATASVSPAPGTAETTSGPVVALPPVVVDRIETAVSVTMSRLGIPGLSIAVACQGTIRFAQGYGFADVENTVPAQAATVYRLASLAKPMTAVVVLKLAGEERLDLDAPIWRYCPAFPEKPWPVTARQLLAHQGGLRHYKDGEQPLTRRFASLSEGLELFKDDPLVHEPGTRVLYSTYGFNLLGCAAEGAAGRPFVEVLRDSVFLPAGMTHTAPDDVRALVPRRAQGYVRDGAGVLFNSALADMSYKVPGGGLAGTAPDVARFGLALISGRLLGAESLSGMLTRQVTRDGRVTGYGQGVTLGTRLGRPEAWQTGGHERVSTVLYLRPDGGPVVTVLANLERIQPQVLELARRVSDIVAPPPPLPPRE